jgi:hypothetical protein
MTQLSVVNPTFNYDVKHESENEDGATPHLDSLSGKIVGLVWNAKPFGDVALRTAEEHISAQYPDVEFRFYSGHQPHPPRLLSKIVEEVDAAILCTAD